jgi:hypothetical protein
VRDGLQGLGEGAGPVDVFRLQQRAGGTPYPSE